MSNLFIALLLHKLDNDECQESVVCSESVLYFTIVVHGGVATQQNSSGAIRGIAFRNRFMTTENR